MRIRIDMFLTSYRHQMPVSVLRGNAAAVVCHREIQLL